MHRFAVPPSCLACRGANDIVLTEERRPESELIAYGISVSVSVVVPKLRRYIDAHYGYIVPSSGAQYKAARGQSMLRPLAKHRPNHQTACQ